MLNWLTRWWNQRSIRATDLKIGDKVKVKGRVSILEADKTLLTLSCSGVYVQIPYSSYHYIGEQLWVTGEVVRISADLIWVNLPYTKNLVFYPHQVERVE